MNRTLIYAFITVLSLGLYACSSSDEPMALQSSPQTSDNNVSEDSENIARLMASIPLNKGIMNEVFSATQNGLENGIEESYYFADMLSESSAKSASRASSTSQESILGRELRSLLNKSRSGNQVDIDLLQNGDYQIYWPYSEDWDGKTQPIITFVPKDENQLWNYGYRQTDDGIETIIVDEEFMESNPVWIINKADLSYDELPNFNNNEFVKNGISYCPRKTVSNHESTAQSKLTRTAGTPVYTVYLGKLMSSKNYDSVWNGGSEFAIQMGAVEHMQITSSDQLRIASPEVTYLRVTRSRKDIKKKRWAELSSAVLSSDWYPNENNAGFCIYEEDQGGTKYWDMSLSIKIKGTDYPLSLKMPYGSGDDLVYKTVYSKNFIFSTNNMNGDTPIVHSSGGVNWTLPYKVGFTVL